LSYPAFALPGSRAPGSRPFRSDLRQCHPAARKRSESRCYPAASHVLENVTRQSRVSTVCHPAVERADCTLYASTRHSENRCYPAASHATRQSRVSIVCHPAVRKPSNSGPDCGLSKHYPAFAVGGPMPPRPRTDVRRLEEPGGAAPPPTLRLERSASVGGELRKLSLSKI